MLDFRERKAADMAFGLEHGIVGALVAWMGACIRLEEYHDCRQYQIPCISHKNNTCNLPQSISLSLAADATSKWFMHCFDLNELVPIWPKVNTYPH